METKPFLFYQNIALTYSFFVENVYISDKIYLQIDFLLLNNYGVGFS